MTIVTQCPLEQRYQPRPLVVLLMLVVFGPGSGIVCPSVSSVTVADHGRTTGRPDNRTTGMQVDIGQFWAEHDIVPVLIDRAPLVFAKVVYRAKKLVDAGKELQPVEVREEPKVEWCADPTALYTLVMLDPDSPSRMEPWNREFAHWLVGNIPGRHVEQGETLYQYIPVFPRAGSGCHRYIFLIFRQQCWNDYAAVERVSSKNRTPRVRFSTRDFAYRYSLGSPVAGNFFLAQYDDYVPVLLSRYPDSNDF